MNDVNSGGVAIAGENCLVGSSSLVLIKQCLDLLAGGIEYRQTNARIRWQVIPDGSRGVERIRITRQQHKGVGDATQNGVIRNSGDNAQVIYGIGTSKNGNHIQLFEFGQIQELR